MAPSTPPPPNKLVFAALTIASTYNLLTPIIALILRFDLHFFTRKIEQILHFFTGKSGVKLHFFTGKLNYLEIIIQFLG